LASRRPGFRVTVTVRSSYRNSQTRPGRQQAEE